MSFFFGNSMLAKSKAMKEFKKSPSFGYLEFSYYVDYGFVAY